MISKDEWLDPLYLESVLSDDEKSIKKSTHRYIYFFIGLGFINKGQKY